VGKLMRSTILTYSELCQLDTFEKRYRYLRLNGLVGNATFGFDRWLNQRFYKDPEWISLRRDIIIRDLGCDLGISDREICGPIMVHHMNPITKEDIIYRSEFLLNPEYLICCSDNTHKAIHYGDESLLVLAPIVRSRNDTCPWRH